MARWSNNVGIAEDVAAWFGISRVLGRLSKV